MFTLVKKHELDDFRKSKRVRADPLVLPDPLMSEPEKALRLTETDLEQIDNDSSKDIWTKIAEHAQRLARHRVDASRVQETRSASGTNYSRLTPFVNSDSSKAAPNSITPTDSTATDQTITPINNNKSSKDMLKPGTPAPSPTKPLKVESKSEDKPKSAAKYSLEENKFINALTTGGFEFNRSTGRLTLGSRVLTKDVTKQLIHDSLAPSKRSPLASSGYTWSSFKKELKGKNIVIPRLNMGVSTTNLSPNTQKARRKGVTDNIQWSTTL